MLKRLKRWPTVSVERHDFAIEDGVANRQRVDRLHDGRVVWREVLLIAGNELRTVRSLQGKRAVAVPFHLVRPILAAGQFSPERRKHWSRQSHSVVCHASPG